MKALFKILLFLALIIGVVFLARNQIAKIAVEKIVPMKTGLNVHVGALDLGVQEHQLGVSELRVDNPDTFPKDAMLVVSEGFVNYDLPSMLKKEIYLKEVRLHIDRVALVKDKNGGFNIKAAAENIKRLQQESATSSTSTEATGATQGKVPFKIDYLSFKFGRLVYKDYSKSEEPEIKVFDLNIDEEFRDIDDPKQLLWSLLKNKRVHKALAGVEGLMVGAFLEQIQGQTQNIIKDGINQINEKIKLPLGILNN